MSRACACSCKALLARGQCGHARAFAGSLAPGLLAWLLAGLGPLGVAGVTHCLWECTCSLSWTACV